MKVKTATLLFSTLIFSLFILLGVSLIMMTNLLDKEAKVLAMAGESIRMATELKSHLLIHNRNAFLYSLHQDPGRLENSKTLRMKIADLIASLDLRITNDKEELVLAELEREIGFYLEKRDQLELSRLPAVDQYNEVSTVLDKILTIVDELIEVNRSQMETLVESIDSQNRMADGIGFFLLALGGIVLLSLIGMIFFYVVHPLKLVSETISKFGSGDASVRVGPGRLAEIRQIGNNFNSMADKLEEKRREQLRFIAAIAHDLRNPLGSMSMASELLNRKGGEEYQDLIGIISRQVKNLDRMVGDLLDTTRIEAGNIDLKFSSHSINSLIRDSIQLHQTGSDLHRLNVDLPAPPLLCQCDGGRISQVLNNLLSNAIKYSPNGGDVTVRVHHAEAGIVVSVSDQGIGIAPQDLNGIFKPFNRTEATRSTIPGIGLGLAASRRIIEAHGGKLWVESQLGSGSTFYFSLPTKMR